MEEGVVLTSVEDQIMTVTINRPKALNAISQAVMSGLRAVFTSLEDRDDVRGVIVTGSGDKAFVAGADIKGFSFDAGMSAEIGRFGHETFNRIETCHVPVVAAVNGFALGGGCELAMACHMRIAAANARFGQPEINLGIIPGYGGTQRLPRLIGKGKALEMLLTGDMIDAQDALSLGLVNAVVEDGEAVNAARKLLKKIGTKAPLAAAEIISLVNQHYVDPEGAMVEETDAFGRCFVTEDAKEGVTAFLEKRKPVFKGR